MTERTLGNSSNSKWHRVGMVARWQPVHLGHHAVLQALCDRADSVQIGIGSANVQDYRTPFTLDEVRDMLSQVLEGRENYALIPVPDLNDGPRWREMVRHQFGSLDILFTDNPYVAQLMKDVYPVSRPVRVVPKEQRVAVSGSKVRLAMAKGTQWEHYLPPVVADYLNDHRLVERFRREYGLQTLAINSMIVERSE